MSRSRQSRLAHGVNVIGLLSAAVGVGVAGRAALRVLDDRGIPHAGIDIQAEGGVASEPLPQGTECLGSLRNMPYDVTVVCLDPIGFERLVLRWNRRTGFDMAHRVNAIMPFWELPVFPESWIPILESFDVILAPSRFVQEVAERSLRSGARPLVLHAPQALSAPRATVVDRARWLGDRADTVAFLSTFDLLSDIERKNPWGAIRAFQLAFPQRQDVSFLIKVNHADAPEHNTRFQQLQSLVAEDRRVLLMTDSLGREDLWSLYASADVYVSLHRSEGLGFGLMESMVVGTPVVATAWSGSMDFTDDGNSVLIPYEMVPVAGTSHRHYDTESWQQWAEPDVRAAAASLEALASSPELRARLGEQAAADMRRRYARQSEPGVYDELVRLALEAPADDSRHDARARAAMRASAAAVSGPGEVVAGLRRVVVGALRAAGLRPPAPDSELPWGPPSIRC